MEDILSYRAAAVTREATLAAAVGGDSEAFADLVRPWLPVALSTATLVTGSSADGADAVQEALLSAWRGLPALREPAAFPAWFRQHVVRSSMRLAAKGKRLRLADLELASPSEGDTIEMEYRRRVLADAFDRLDPKDRTILSLRYVSDLPIAETAVALGIPEGTVKSRLHAAVERLRAAYEAEERQ
jgi:RNA polymerase sigma-70 factor (ECF subfamily)